MDQGLCNNGKFNISSNEIDNYLLQSNLLELNSINNVEINNNKFISVSQHNNTKNYKNNIPLDQINLNNKKITKKLEEDINLIKNNHENLLNFQNENNYILNEITNLKNIYNNTKNNDEYNIKNDINNININNENITIDLHYLTPNETYSYKSPLNSTLFLNLDTEINKSENKINYNKLNSIYNKEINEKETTDLLLNTKKLYFCNTNYKKFIYKANSVEQAMNILNKYKELMNKNQLSFNKNENQLEQTKNMRKIINNENRLLNNKKQKKLTKNKMKKTLLNIENGNHLIKNEVNEKIKLIKSVKKINRNNIKNLFIDFNNGENLLSTNNIKICEHKKLNNDKNKLIERQENRNIYKAKLKKDKKKKIHNKTFTTKNSKNKKQKTKLNNMSQINKSVFLSPGWSKINSCLKELNAPQINSLEITYIH